MRILIFILFAPLGLIAQSEIDSISFPKVEVAVAAAEGKVVFAGGRQTFSNDIPFDTLLRQNRVVDIFDTQKGEWTQDTLQYAKDDAKAVALGSDIYIAGDASSPPNGELRFVEVYNVNTGEWKALTLPTLEEVDVITEENGWIFFAHGNKVDLFNPVDSTWESFQLSEGPERNDLGIASCEGKVFFAGGGSPDQGLFNKIDVYDIASGTLDSLSLGLARTRVACECLNGKVYFIGGNFDFFSYTDLIEVYDIGENTWDSLFMDENKIGFATAVLGTKLYVAGGIDEREDPSSTIEVYDTETGEKEFLQLSVARSEFNGIAYEGRIFFAGGNLGGIGPYTHRVDVLGEPFEPTSTYRNLSENLVYYPNPVSRSLKVEVYKHNEFPLSYEIFSLAGKKMYEGTLKTPFQEIHLENLQKGIYLLKFEGIKGIGKLVKQ